VTFLCFTYMRVGLPIVLALALAVPPAALAGETGVLAGYVLPAAGNGSAAKTVWVGAIPAPVAADGSFEATGVPAGQSELAIETSEGLYVVATPVAIAPGATRRVQLAYGGRQDTSAPKPSENQKKKKGGGFWANPLSATLVIVGSAIVVGFAINQLTQSNNEPVSPS
jgi:hypothetical protein